MKKILFYTFLLFTCSTSFSQTNYPGILVVSPYTTTSALDLKKEELTLIENCKNGALKKEVYTKEASFEIRTENVKASVYSEINFLKNMTLERYPSHLVYEMLGYRFFQAFKTSLVLVDTQRCDGLLDSYRSIAKQNQVQFVVNPKSVKFSGKSSKKTAEITYEVYDAESDSIIFNKTSIGTSENNGFEYTCTDGSIFCCISNAHANAERELIQAIAGHLESNKNIAAIRKEQEEILLSKMNGKPVKSDFFRKYFDLYEWEVNPSSIYFQLFNADSTKFTILAIDEVEGSEYFKFDAKRLDGILYNNQWYIDGNAENLFSAETLEEAKVEFMMQELTNDFFIRLTTSENPEYWQLNTFETVESQMEENKEEVEVMRKHLADPNASEQDKDMCKIHIELYEDRDELNKPYFGMPKIIADKLKDEVDEKNQQFESSFSEQNLEPFYNRNKGKNDIKSFVSVSSSDPTLIYPDHHKQVLIPTVQLLTNGKKKLVYYLFLQNEDLSYAIYEWTYFKPLEPKENDFYSTLVIDQLEQICNWNFGYISYNNEAFWNLKVLSKENGAYSYLRKLE